MLINTSSLYTCSKQSAKHCININKRLKNGGSNGRLGGQVSNGRLGGQVYVMDDSVVKCMYLDNVFQIHNWKYIVMFLPASFMLAFYEYLP